MMREPIEQRGRHLGVAEDGRPFSEGEVGGDDDRRALIKPADQMEQQLAAGLGYPSGVTRLAENEVSAMLRS